MLTPFLSVVSRNMIASTEKIRKNVYFIFEISESLLRIPTTFQ